MLSAAELEITKEEYAALAAVRDGLASGAFVHVPYSEAMETSAPIEGPLFNMEIGCADRSCGTVGCIGGWVALTMGMKTRSADAYVGKHYSPSLDALFYPHSVFAWDAITPNDAARAIDNFLECGDPRWADVVDETDV